MSALAFVLTSLVSATIGAVAMALACSAGSVDDCRLCHDTGNYAHDELFKPAEHRWCVCPRGVELAGRAEPFGFEPAGGAA